MSDTTALADGFDPVDRARWRELVAAAMRRSNGDVAPDETHHLHRTDDGDLGTRAHHHRCVV